MHVCCMYTCIYALDLGVVAVKFSGLYILLNTICYEDSNIYLQTPEAYCMVLASFPGPRVSGLGTRLYMVRTEVRGQWVGADLYLPKVELRI